MSRYEEYWIIQRLGAANDRKSFITEADAKRYIKSNCNTGTYELVHVIRVPEKKEEEKVNGWWLIVDKERPSDLVYFRLTEKDIKEAWGGVNQKRCELIYVERATPPKPIETPYEEKSPLQQAAYLLDQLIKLGDPAQVRYVPTMEMITKSSHWLREYARATQTGE